MLEYDRVVFDGACSPERVDVAKGEYAAGRKGGVRAVML